MKKTTMLIFSVLFTLCAFHEFAKARKGKSGGRTSSISIKSLWKRDQKKINKLLNTSRYSSSKSQTPRSTKALSTTKNSRRSKGGSRSSIESQKAQSQQKSILKDTSLLTYNKQKLQPDTTHTDKKEIKIPSPPSTKKSSSTTSLTHQKPELRKESEIEKKKDDSTNASPLTKKLNNDITTTKRSFGKLVENITNATKKHIKDNVGTYGDLALMTTLYTLSGPAAIAPMVINKAIGFLG